MFKKIISYLLSVSLVLSQASTVIAADYNYGVAQTAPVQASQQMSAHDAIYRYAATGNLSNVRNLVARGVSIEGLDSNNNTPLCEAIWRGNQVAFKTLMQAGANASASCVSQIPARYKTAIGMNAAQPARTAVATSAATLVAGSTDDLTIRTNSVTPDRIYQLATEGRSDILTELSDANVNLDMTFKNGQTAYCHALDEENCDALEALQKAGANVDHACVKRLPAEKQEIKCSGAFWWWVAGGTAVAIAAGTAIALASSGGGSGGGDGGWVDPCDNVSCDANQSCSAGICVCDAGYTMQNGTCYETLDCGMHGVQDGNSCVCDAGYAGNNCSSCDTGYGNHGTTECYADLTCPTNATQVADVCQCDAGYDFYGTTQCYATLSCVDGTQQADVCVCNGHSDGTLCDECETGYDFYGTNQCYETLACVNGTQEGGICSCVEGYEGTLCDTPSACTGYDDTTCPTGYTSSSTCLSGTTTKLKCDICADGYGYYGTNVCNADLTCGANQVQEGSECVCQSGYELIEGACTFTSCPANQYKTGNACFACPEHSTSQLGAQSSADCICDTGYLKNAAGLCVEVKDNIEGTNYVYKLGTDTGFEVYNSDDDITVTTSQTALKVMEGGTVINNATIHSTDNSGNFLIDGNNDVVLINNGRIESDGSLSANGSIGAMKATSLSTMINNGFIEAEINNISGNGTYTAMLASDSSASRTSILNNYLIDITLTNNAGSITGYGMRSTYGTLTNSTSGNISMEAAKSESDSSGQNGKLSAMSTSYGSITNKGVIDVVSDYYGMSLYGLEKIYSSALVTNLKNEGTINLTSSGASLNLYALFAGQYTVNTNLGTITVQSTGNSTNLYGMTGSGNYNSVNSGSISLTASGTGTNMYGMGGDTTTSSNDGDISITRNAGNGNIIGAYGSQTGTGTIEIVDNSSTNVSSSSIVGLNTGTTGKNYGSIEITSNLSVSDVYGTRGGGENHGSIVLNLLRTEENSSAISSSSYPQQAEYHGMSNTTTQAVKNYGSILLTSNNTNDDYTGGLGSYTTHNYYGLVGISSSSANAFNYGDIIVDKQSLYNEQTTVGVGIDSDKSFYNGFKDADETEAATISVTSIGAGVTYGVSVDTGSISQSIINDGIISVWKKANTASTGAVRGITNDDGAFNVTNNGTITATNNGTNPATGIYLKSSYSATPSQVINTGSITAETTGGGNAYGIYVEAPRLSDSTVALVNIYNEGTITVSTSGVNNISGNVGTAYGIWASGRDTKVYNTGTIIVNGVSKTGSDAADACDTGTVYYVSAASDGTTSTYLDTYTKDVKTNNVYTRVVASQAGYYTTRTGSGTAGDPYVLSGFTPVTNHIYLTNGATFVDGGYTSLLTAVNFSSLTNSNSGHYAVTNGFSMSTPSASGLLEVDSSTVTSGYNTQYTIANAFDSGDVSGLELASNSHLFNASINSTSDTTHDIVMTMKSFGDVTSNKSLAKFLENNYTLQNNEGFFNQIKSASNATAFNSMLSSVTGMGSFSKFMEQDLTAMRDLNQSMNNMMFENNDKYAWSQAGFVQSKNKKDDNTSNSQFSLFNKKLSPSMRVGWGLAFTNVSANTEDRTSNHRDSMFQFFMPFGYQKGGVQMISSPRVGFSSGTYTRKGLAGSYEGKIEKRIFGVTNEARYPISVGGISFEPAVEFNTIGYNQNGSEEDKPYALRIQNKTNVSVEGGFGFYAKHESTLNSGSTLKLNSGLMFYREFADPYSLKMGMEGMAGSFDLYDDRSPNRAVAQIGADYKWRNLNIYGAVQHFMETEPYTSVKTGIKIAF